MKANPIGINQGLTLGTTAGRVWGMARKTTKVTLSLENEAWRIAQKHAELAGQSPSAWLSRAARNEAVRSFVPPSYDEAAAEAQAAAEEAEYAASLADHRERSQGAA